MIDGVQELRVHAQSTCDRTQPSDMLRVAPTGVVASAIAVGDERGPHGLITGEGCGRAALFYRPPAAVGDEKRRAVPRSRRRDRRVFVEAFVTVELNDVVIEVLRDR